MVKALQHILAVQGFAMEFFTSLFLSAHWNYFLLRWIFYKLFMHLMWVYQILHEILIIVVFFSSMCLWLRARKNIQKCSLMVGAGSDDCKIQILFLASPSQCCVQCFCTDASSSCLYILRVLRAQVLKDSSCRKSLIPVGKEVPCCSKKPLQAPRCCSCITACGNWSLLLFKYRHGVYLSKL